MFGAHIERYLRAKRQGESEREESQRRKKEDPQKRKDPLGAAAKHSALPCRQRQAPYEPHGGATLGSTAKISTFAQSWSDRLLLLLTLTISRLSPLVEKEEQSARRAMKVQNVPPDRPRGKGSPMTGGAVSTQMFVILLLLLQLLKGASAVCSYTSNSVPATVDASGNLVIPKEWTSVPGYAFYASAGFNPDCRTTLKYVTFEEPSKVTSIGNSAFASDTSLVSIFLPSSLTSMEENVFRDSYGPLVVFNCAGPAVSFDGYAFYNSGINTIYVPAGSSGGTNYVNMQRTLACCPAGKYSSTGGNQAGCTSGACTSVCTGCPAGKYSR